jgi:hypothetical protein
MGIMRALLYRLIKSVFLVAASLRIGAALSTAKARARFGSRGMAQDRFDVIGVLSVLLFSR